MSARLDLVLQKHPDHADGIRLLASRDPSGNLKYLDWGTKVLISGQALAPEIADILDLFHRFRGYRGPHGAGHVKHVDVIRADIYTYRPQDLASLRDNLLKIKRVQDRKLRKREKLYRIEGTIEADTVYESHDLIVRHIKNKQASVHYGHNTKWCISMLREGYFEDYETENATFFFFERKAPVGDEFDKVALMVPRSNTERRQTVEVFTALDQRVDMMVLAKVHGSRVFDIFREIHERSERYPGSAMFQIYAGIATQEQLENAFAGVVNGDIPSHETDRVLLAIVCNDSAPQTLLEEIARRADALSAAARARRSSRRLLRRCSGGLERAVQAAMSIHPNMPADAREKLVKELRRRHVDTDTIHRTADGGQIELVYELFGGDVSYRGHYRRHRRLRHYRRHPSTVKDLRARAAMFDRKAARMRRQARTLQRKLTKAKKRKKPTARRRR